MLVTKWTEDDLSLLWREYKLVGSFDLRNRLVEAYLPLVKGLVIGLMGRAFAKFIGQDELEAAGNLGLMQAVEGFDLDRGIKFETYASTRIRGAILDWLRNLDWIPRKVRSNARLYNKAVAALSGGSREQPTIEEVANYLHVSIETAQALAHDAKGAETHVRQGGEEVRGEFEDNISKTPSLDSIPDHREPVALDEMTKGDGFDNLIACLNDREQIIIVLYYRESFTMKQIGLILSMSESRISQMHDRALLKIKDSFL